MKRVVVTGKGIVSPVGVGFNTAWDQLISAQTGIDYIDTFDTENLPVKIAACVKGFSAEAVLDKKELNRTSRFCQFALVAADEAIKDSGLDVHSGDTTRWGTSIGVGLGALNDIEQSTLVLHRDSPRRVSPFFIPYAIPNMAAGIVSRNYNLKGPNICPTTACSSGTHGVGEAWLYLTSGIADVMVAGGAEAAVSPLSIASFANMKALSRSNDNPQTASRPFDKDRNGFVMGEGCGLLVLETLEHAQKRGANILAEMVGYGMSGDAFHITAPAPDGEGGERCMREALKAGSISPDQVDYLNAHGTSTKLNDQYETSAVKRIFGSDTKLNISSTKGATGHCLGGAGGIEAVFTVGAIHEGVVPPTINYETPDPDCDLNYTPNEAVKKEIQFAMSNSFGFGGTNATILFKRFQ